MSGLPWLAMCIGTLCAHVAFAEQTADASPGEEENLAMAYGDGNFVSIATGNRQLVKNAPSIATVVTAADIAAMGATDLDEVMETVPGVHVNRVAVAYAPSYTFRGISSVYNAQVLMLVNGKPITDGFLGSRGNVWGGLPLENVSRIEVIRGPGSALYGADAYAGTINIITRTAEEIDGAQAGVRGGSFNAWSAWLQQSGQLGPVTVAAYAQIGSTHGQREIVAADAATRLDTLFHTQASLAPGPVNNRRDFVDAALDLSYDKWRLRFAAMDRLGVGSGAGISNALDPIGVSQNHRATADLSWRDPNFAQDWNLAFDARFQHISTVADLVLFPPGTRLPNPVGAGSNLFPNGLIGSPARWQRQFGLSGTAQYTGFADHRVRIGLGHDDLDLYKTTDTRNFTYAGAGIIPTAGNAVVDYSSTMPYILPHRRRTTYAYIQDEWSFAQSWTLTAGLRYDSYSDFGSTTNPRLALVWETTPAVTTKFMYGTAFRAPSLAEAYSISNPVNQGNPDLQPERIQTLEGAVSWQMRSDLQVSLNVFHHRMSSLIRPVVNLAPAVGSTYQNTGQQTGSGGELEIVWNAYPTLRLSGNYAYQRNVDQTTGHDAGYAPHHHIYARADWRFVPGWLANVQANHVAGRLRAWGDTRDQIPDYTTVDFTLRTDKPRQGWDFAASIRNAFNADVREPSQLGSNIIYDLPMPRRSFWVQARYSL